MLILIGVGYAVYSNTFDVPFLFDDKNYIVDNRAVQTFTIGRYGILTRAISFLTFALNYRLHGFDVVGYHVFNLIVHVSNALLVYILIVLTFRAPFFSVDGKEYGNSDGTNHITLAFVAALIFVCHPIQTQAVTYISQRFASLATLFYLLSMVSYVSFRISGSAATKKIFYIVSLLSAVLAMGTKEIAYTLPVNIILYELLFFPGKDKRTVRRLAPFALTMVIIPLLLLKGNQIIEKYGVEESIKTVASTSSLSVADYFITQLRVIVTYIRLLLFPINQNFDYDYPVYHSLFNPSVLASFFFLVGVFLLSLYLLRLSADKGREDKQLLRLSAFGLLWFFITLSIESSIVPIFDVIFEHRMYLPSVGFIIFFVSSAVMLQNRLRFSGIKACRAVIPALIIIAAVFSVMTYMRNGIWRDEVIFWQDAVKKSPAKVRPHTNLGLAYYKYGRPEEAVQEFITTVRLEPDYALGYYNVGIVRMNQGRLEEAQRDFQMAIYFDPNHEGSHYHLGVILLMLGRLEESAQKFTTVTHLRPSFSNAHYNLGIVYVAQSRFDDAIREYLTVIQLDPDSVMAYNNLGMIYKTEGRFEEAVNAFRRASLLQPENMNIRKNLEMAIKAMNQRKMDS